MCGRNFISCLYYTLCFKLDTDIFMRYCPVFVIHINCGVHHDLSHCVDARFLAHITREISPLFNGIIGTTQIHVDNTCFDSANNRGVHFRCVDHTRPITQIFLFAGRARSNIRKSVENCEKHRALPSFRASAKRACDLHELFSTFVSSPLTIRAI